MQDIKLKGIHCSTVGLEVYDTERPLFGAFSDEFIKLPEVSGDIVISDNTESDIDVRIQFLLTPPAGKTYFDALRSVRDYFKSDYKEQLVFDNDPGYAYMAKFTSMDNIEQIIDEGLFWATFRCSAEMVVAT